MAGVLTEDMTHVKGLHTVNNSKQNGSIPSVNNHKEAFQNNKLEKSKILAENEDDNNNNNNNAAINRHETTLKYYGENEDYTRTATVLQDFYKGANIFITGGTGFLGKILINKLIRSCPDLETIYLLVRNKKGKDIYSRIDEIFDDCVFDEMKKQVPKYRHKIEIIQGDVSLAGLGLSVTDRQTLTEKVNIVFHAAATVRFDERLDLALSINVDGVHAILDICRSMRNLKSLVHVSTAYTNCYCKQQIKEAFYEYSLTYDDVRKKICKMDETAIADVTKDILGPWPNTYTFTKALAEDCIKKKSKGLPIGMFRPAIVTSTLNEPLQGWIDNVYGPTGVIAGAATGLLRTLYCNENLHANIVPVDLCVNALIASAWDIATNCKERNGENMLIYNYVATPENPITWKRFCYLNSVYGFRYPLGSAVWYFGLTLNKSYAWDRIYSVLFHYVPALIVDGLSMCVGQKPRMMKMYGKIHKFSDVISYFCTNEWDFLNDNVKSLWTKLDKKDKSLFPFNMNEVDWISYFSFYLKGMRTYLFKEKITQEDAVRKWRRLYVYHILLKIFSISAISYGLWSIFFRIFYKPSS